MLYIADYIYVPLHIFTAPSSYTPGSYVPHNLVKEGKDEGVTAKGLEV